jgi:hypothetical protein
MTFCEAHSERAIGFREIEIACLAQQVACRREYRILLSVDYLWLTLPYLVQLQEPATLDDLFLSERSAVSQDTKHPQTVRASLRHRPATALNVLQDRANHMLPFRAVRAVSATRRAEVTVVAPLGIPFLDNLVDAPKVVFTARHEIESPIHEVAVQFLERMVAIGSRHRFTLAA